MSCTGCTVGNNGKPHGCRSHGTCASGSCNRLNVYDWLADIPVVDTLDVSRFVEVSFKNGARKGFFRNSHKLLIDTHDLVVVETGVGGYNVGVVSLTGELVKLQMKRKRVPENSDDIVTVVRKANDYDIRKWEESIQREKEVMIRARAIARQMKLDMKVGDVEFQGDGRKATFYYTADGRVDFRELIKVYAKEFQVRIDMHQIGARQEAGRIGGIGSCGRELCCSTWLTEFKTVGTAAARYQQLAINQSKLSGQCGRLKCCLNYELDTYLDALQGFPQDIDKLETEAGMVFLQKTDIFRGIMWFAYKSSTIFHPLTPDRVKEISTMNKSGQKPADLASIAVDVSASRKQTSAEEEEPEYKDVVGQTSLTALEKKNKRNKNRNRGHQRNRNRNRDGRNDRRN